jgi:aryl-alcohol dehydrogenase-like predicted oxidoreductase
MRYRPLGKSDLQISPLCLGAMMFGGQTDEYTARAIAGRALEQGINFIDTANVYNDGKSEEVVGRLIAGKRDKWVLASKFGGGRLAATAMKAAPRAEPSPRRSKPA